MTVDEAKVAIMAWVCEDWQRLGEDASWDRDALQRHVNIPYTIFSRALVELVLDRLLVYLPDRPTHLRLDRAGVALCEEMVSKSNRTDE